MRTLLRYFLGLQFAMALGALVCLVVGGALRSSSMLAPVYRPGTVMFFLGDVIFLTVPVVAWMAFRDRGWQHSLELAAAMLAPVAAIVVVGEMTQSVYLVWLITAMYPAMSIGMIAYLLYRRDVFVGPYNVVGMA